MKYIKTKWVHQKHQYCTNRSAVVLTGITALFLSTKYLGISADLSNCFMFRPYCAFEFTQVRFFVVHKSDKPSDCVVPKCRSPPFQHDFETKKIMLEGNYMAKTYWIWESTENTTQWVEITGKQFYELVTSSAGKGRYFMDFDDYKIEVSQEEIKLAVIRQKGSSKAELEGRIQAENKAIRLLEESITKNFTTLISGKITQEIFLSKKEVINQTIAQKKKELEMLHIQLEAVTLGKGVVEEKLAKIQLWHSIEKLDRDIIDLLVDRVLVLGENQIEIV